MSSRTGNGDPWGTLEIWTAYRGPRARLRRQAHGHLVMTGQDGGSPDNQQPPGKLPPARLPSGKKPPGQQPPGPPSAGTGWTVVSYLIGGMILYGGIGWLIGRWTGIAALFPVGMLVGLALATVLIIFRYARH